VLAVGLILLAGGRVLDRLLTGVVAVDGFFFALTGAGVIVLRHRRREATRHVKVPLYPFVPALFSLLMLGIVLGSYVDPSKRVTLWFAGGWIVAGAVVYGVLSLVEARRSHG